MLQSLKRFIIPAFSPVFYNLGIILFVVLFSDRFGMHAAAWGTVFGAFLHFIIQVPLLRKCGFSLFGGFRWQPAKLRELFLLAGPRTIAMVIEQLNLWVVTFLATSIGGISLTLVTVAQQLMSIPIRFFGVSIAQAALPFFAANAHDQVGFRRMVFRSLRQISFFALPASTLLLILRVAIIRLAYGVEKLPWRATLDAAEVLGILSVSIAAQACTLLLVRAFYSMNNTVIPFFASVVYFATTVILGWYCVLMLNLGLTGIAVSLTLAGILETLILFIVFLMKNHFQDFGQFGWSMARIGVASVLMGITLFIFQRLFDLYVFETSRVLQLIGLTTAVGTLGSLVYLGFCWLLKIEELTILSRIFHKLRSQWNRVVGNTPEFVESVSPMDQVS
jgi:putative peptidoglycan lipid II flippase